MVSSSTEGKAEKSSGRTMYAAIIITIKAVAMFSVKKVSSIHGGMGSTISARMAITKIGAAKPWNAKPFLVLQVCRFLNKAVFMVAVLSNA